MARKSKAPKKSAAPAKRETGGAKTPAPAGSPVKARFTLRSLGGQTPRSPDATRETVRRIIQQAESECGARPEDVKIYPNIDTFAVSGAPELVESLAQHEEVAAQLPEVSSKDIMIRPVRKRVVKLKSDRPKRRRK